MKLPFACISRVAACLGLLGYLLAAPAAGAASRESRAELITVGQQIWLLTAAGRVHVYDASGKLLHLPAVEAVKAEHLAADGDNVVAQIGPTVQRWNPGTATWTTIGKLARNVFALTVTSRHQLFAITNMGVLDVATGYCKLPATSPNHQLRELRSFERPAACFMDREDNLWIGFGYGEWGGNVFTYSTSKHRFLDLSFHSFSIELHPVKSFFQLPNGVGVSAGLQHFSTSGCLAEFTNLNARLLYDTWADRDSASAQHRFSAGQPYIGPATYDAATNRLYFYSHLGVYEGEYGQNLARLTAWHKLFAPSLPWRNGQPDAIGSPMNVLRLLPLGPGKLVLLTQSGTAGLWDGQTFTLLP